MNDSELEKLISSSLRDFHDRRLAKVKSRRLSELLGRKNPYLFRALGLEEVSEIVRALLEAQLSSSDESIFGDAFFEPIARIASGGKKSGAKGVDIELETEAKFTAIAVKSGPNPFNSGQRNRQNDDFNEMRRRLFQLNKQYDPVLAHSYGRKISEPSQRQVYRETSGQAFWEEITGDPEFYLKLITKMRDEPLKYKEEFAAELAAVNNNFTRTFAKNFCLDSGHVDWESLLKYVSAKEKRPRLKAG